MIRVIICDDDEFFLSTMMRIVDDLLASLSIRAKIHTYICGEEIGTPILASCDIALLDIDFSGRRYNGIDIARKLRTLRADAVLIFITNYVEYAPEGYEVKAFRYLLKKDVQQKLPAYFALAVEELTTSRQTLKIRINGEIIDLRLNEIMYIESQLRMVDVHMQKTKACVQGKIYRYYATMADLEKLLEPQGFLRIHKSYLVNMQFVRRFQNKEVLLHDGTSLKVGEKNYAEKKRKYLMWKGY